MSKPNLFIFGFPKCGTTSLAAFLSMIPDVYVPPNKEPGILHGAGRDPYTLLKKYMASCPVGCKFYVDATPTYIVNVDTCMAVARMLSLDMCSSKYIVLVRDPIKRLLSHYHHNKNRLAETRPLEEIIDSEIGMIDQGKLENTEYIKSSMYLTYLNRLLNHTNRSNVIVLQSERLSESDYLKPILSNFLNIDINETIEIPKINTLYNPRFTVLHKALFSQNIVFRGVRASIPRLLKERVKLKLLDANNRKAGHNMSLSALHEMRLQELFSEEVVFGVGGRNDNASP